PSASRCARSASGRTRPARPRRTRSRRRRAPSTSSRRTARSGASRCRPGSATTSTSRYWAATCTRGTGSSSACDARAPRPRPRRGRPGSAGRGGSSQADMRPLIQLRDVWKVYHLRDGELLAAVGLRGREHHLPSQLSGGQQQRVAIARALANGPSMLLADEPTGNLDTQSSAEIMDLFLRLRREQRITIVLVTHETDIADYTERIVTFRDGRIVSDVPHAPSRLVREVAQA